MESPPSFIFLPILFHILVTFRCTSAVEPACHTKCGPLEVKYPLGTGYGCGSPRFHPYVTCPPAGDQLLLTTHTGSYPITSISYATSTLTITPPSMSTCTSMQPSPTKLGLDWASPFQLGPSTFILLSCPPPTSSLTIKGTPICDPSSSYLCASIYTCPAVVTLGLPLFPPTNTCCVYSPANLDNKNEELDLNKLKCAGYASVVSLGDAPTDPSQWQYGVALKYSLGGLENYNTATSCHGCELSDGVCGYSPPGNSFVCVCKSGFNTSTDCYYYNHDQDFFMSSTSQLTWKVCLGLLAGLLSCMAA
uniref:non-specific serine/threonine protein kinase n=1 Tax=Davidia involucrata TaxID=16924 RepID=A0A5B7BSK8_DAVIN